MPKESEVFFKFWHVDVSVFEGVAVCPLSEFYHPLIDPQTLDGIYVSPDRRIYLRDMKKAEVFFHEASHHVTSLYAPHLDSDVHGHAIEETVADIAAAAVKLDDVPTGVGWSLIEAGQQLKSCRKVHSYAYLGPRLPDKCILTAIKYRPELIVRLFSQYAFFF